MENQPQQENCLEIKKGGNASSQAFLIIRAVIKDLDALQKILRFQNEGHRNGTEEIFVFSRCISLQCLLSCFD